MGTSVTKIFKSVTQIDTDMIEINKITKNKLFEKRTGFMIDFSYIRKKKNIMSVIAF